MSGGHFDYQQYRIHDIADSIQRVIKSNNVDISDEFGHSIRINFNESTINEFKNAIEYLKIAQIYASRIDWLLSGDDSESTFHERLKEDLINIKRSVYNDN